jgi:uncharacterized protein (DUF488 family)
VAVVDSEVVEEEEALAVDVVEDKRQFLRSIAAFERMDALKDTLFFKNWIFVTIWPRFRKHN